MSTILDALKKIERDRAPAARHDPGIPDRDSSLRSDGRLSIRWIGVAASALMAGGALAFLLLRTGSPPAPPEAKQVVSGPGTQVEASVPPPAAGRPARGVEPAVAPPPGTAASVRTQSGSLSTAAKLIKRRQRAEARAAMAAKVASASLAAREPRPTGGASRRAAGPAAAEPRLPEPAAITPPDPGRGTVPSELHSPRPPSRVATRAKEADRPRPRLTLPPITSPTPAPEAFRDVGAVEDGRLASFLAFPEVELMSVRWHPEEQRREARLIIDGRRPIDARQGDIVAGVAIRRIDPGAVELQVGRDRRRIVVGR